MHTDLLNPTTLRGYRQVNMGGSPYSYLGPAIVVQKDTPVRIKFINSLPTGEGGNLFIPVDSTVMGSGAGPDLGMMENMADPQNPLCSRIIPVSKTARCYAENRATLHLHGGISPWISDGTPHQWITPAGESHRLPAGRQRAHCSGYERLVAMRATDGCMTFYYTNQQSARLMFYHDHAWGITRLNVYAGEAAAYIITDDTEQALVSYGYYPRRCRHHPAGRAGQDLRAQPGTTGLAGRDLGFSPLGW